MTELTQQRKEQELFERTISDNNPSRIDLEMVLPGVYVNKQVQAAWEGWQAGRSSLESENAKLHANFDAVQKDLNIGGRLQILTSRALAAESENERLRELVTEAEELFDLIGKFAGGDLTRIRIWRGSARGAIRGGTNAAPES